MERERAVEILKRHESDIRALGVASLSLFGSTARGEARPDSDIDVLVDIPKSRKFSLLDLSGLRLFLCDVFGRDADVVIRDGMRPKFRERASKDELRVF